MADQAQAKRARFRHLHEQGVFVMPNPWDAGSARVLEHLGFPALATTSSGFAASLGRLDQHTTRAELVAHVALVAAAVEVPVSVDAECCFPHEPGGIAETIEQLAAAGAAGASIEDFDPAVGRVLDRDVAAERVAIAAAAGHRHGLVITARAEQLLYGSTDLDDVIDRLGTYRAAGADVTFAPGLADPARIRRLVDEVGGPVNVLARRDGPSVAELGALGVRRVSTGGSLAWAAFGALVNAARELQRDGTSTYLDHAIDPDVRTRALGRP